tara:strand:- start:30 stop:287 length:258 start_codon:yes stop_codon:yes gene_type:complete
MFNFEKITSSLKEKKSKIHDRIEKATFLKPTRSSSIPNPLDDTIATTEKFWDKVNRGVYDDPEVIDINTEKSLENSRDNNSEKAA